MISAIAVASRLRKIGTFATMLQVTTNWRRWMTSEKAVATMPTGSASMATPMIAARPPMTLPSAVTGTTSP